MSACREGQGGLKPGSSLGSPKGAFLRETWLLSVEASPAGPGRVMGTGRWGLLASSRARPQPLVSPSLISTDATARGIDVQGVQLVINYDAPQYLRTYVHR